MGFTVFKRPVRDNTTSVVCFSEAEVFPSLPERETLKARRIQFLCVGRGSRFIFRFIVYVILLSKCSNNPSLPYKTFPRNRANYDGEELAFNLSILRTSPRTIRNLIWMHLRQRLQELGYYLCVIRWRQPVSAWPLPLIFTPQSGSIGHTCYTQTVLAICCEFQCGFSSLYLSSRCPQKHEAR